MATDFSKYSTFEESRLDAIVQILICGYNGWRTLETVMDISDLTGNIIQIYKKLGYADE